MLLVICFNKNLTQLDYPRSRFSGILNDKKYMCFNTYYCEKCLPKMYFEDGSKLKRITEYFNMKFNVFY